MLRDEFDYSDYIPDFDDEECPADEEEETPPAEPVYELQRFLQDPSPVNSSIMKKKKNKKKKKKKKENNSRKWQAYYHYFN